MGIKPSALIGEPRHAKTCILRVPHAGVRWFKEACGAAKGLPVKWDMNDVWMICSTKRDLRALVYTLDNDSCKQIFLNQTEQFRRIKRSDFSRVSATFSFFLTLHETKLPVLINLEQRDLKVPFKELALPGILLLVTWVDYHVASFVPWG